MSLIEDLRTQRATDFLSMSLPKLPKGFRCLENILVMSSSQRSNGSNKTPTI